MKNTSVNNDKKRIKAEKRELQNQIDAVDVRALPKTKIVPSVFTTDKASHKSVPYGTLFVICIFTIAALFVTFLSVSTVSLLSVSYSLKPVIRLFLFYSLISDVSTYFMLHYPENQL